MESPSKRLADCCLPDRASGIRTAELCEPHRSTAHADPIRGVSEIALNILQRLARTDSSQRPRSPRRHDPVVVEKSGSQDTRSVRDLRVTEAFRCHAPHFHSVIAHQSDQRFVSHSSTGAAAVPHGECAIPSECIRLGERDRPRCVAAPCSPSHGKNIVRVKRRYVHISDLPNGTALPQWTTSRSRQGALERVGAGLTPAPPTPPDVRVRIRRFASRPGNDGRDR